MRILHITASMDPQLGGVCQAVKSIVKGLEVFPHIENEVLSFDDPDAIFIGQIPCLAHFLGAGKGPLLYNENYVAWLAANVLNYDAVILHGLWTYQGFGLNKALQKLGWRSETSTTKLFVMPHGMLDPYFQKAKGRKLKAIRNWIYWKAVEKKVINIASGLLFTCEAEMELARQTFSPYQPKKQTVVGLGVEEPPKQTSAIDDAFGKIIPKSAHRPFLLYLSRIHEKKGTDILVKGYQNSYKHSSDAAFNGQKTDYELVIAGPGLETSFGNRVKNLAEAAGEQQITFPGMLSGDSKWGAFYNCDAFVLISHQENFGIAVVEALACGKPVLISNQVNIWKEIAADHAGIICTDNQNGADELFLKWRQLSYKEKEEMSRNARRCYQNHFSMQQATEKFLKSIAD